MVKVAIVGATSHVAGYLIPAIAEKHEVVTLTRKPSNPEVHVPNIHRYSHLPNVHSVVVDYSKPAALDAALQGVHTVISTIFNFNKDAYVNTSLALLESALRVGVKRFAPSEFAAHGLPNDTIEVYRYKAIVSEAVRKSGIEYTLFDTGFWMNMLAAGTPGANGMSYTPIFDVGNCSARIPGDGSAYLVYIRGEDMAKFVAASLELEKWPAVSRMVGDRKTFNEILRIAEEVRGEWKFILRTVRVG